MSTSPNAFRIEHDSMGELQVPADALWGAQTQRAVQNFPISHRPMPRGFIRALGLIKAAALIEDGRIDGFVKERYASFNSDLGKKIRSGKASLEELSEKALKKGNVELPGSGMQEYLESVVNEVLFGQ